MKSEQPGKSKECIFCKIIAGTLPSERVYESKTVYAFRDISPQAPVHVLIVPRKHVEDVLDVVPTDLPLFADLFQAIQHIAGQLGVAGSGFRIVLNSGDHACQTIYHLHIHLLGGAQLSGSMVG